MRPKKGAKMSKEYEEYMLSERWFAKRREVFRAKGIKCQVCSTSSYLHIHHGTYERFTKELIDDLFVLCKPCHKKLHKEYKKSRCVRCDQNLYLFTVEFIKSKSKHMLTPLTTHGYRLTRRQRKRKNRDRLVVSAQERENLYMKQKADFKANRKSYLKDV